MGRSGRTGTSAILSRFGRFPAGVSRAARKTPASASCPGAEDSARRGKAAPLRRFERRPRTIRRARVDGFPGPSPRGFFRSSGCSRGPLGARRGSPKSPACGEFVRSGLLGASGRCLARRTDLMRLGHVPDGSAKAGMQRGRRLRGRRLPQARPAATRDCCLRLRAVGQLVSLSRGCSCHRVSSSSGVSHSGGDSADRHE
jgi:hypothetical protein